MTQLLFNVIVRITKRWNDAKVGLCRLSIYGGSEMNAMNKRHFDFLNHSEHHSWRGHECWHENSLSNCKSIFVNGVSA